MSVDLLGPGIEWANREDGTPVPTPINYSPDTFNNTPGVRAYISGAPIAGQAFGGVNATISVFMAEPVEFVQLSMIEYGGNTIATVDIPYDGEDGGGHLYQLDGVAELSSVFTVPAGADSAFEISTSAYPSQGIMPINFNVSYFELTDAPAPPSGCFWTDLVGVTQDCAEAPSPVRRSSGARLLYVRR